MVNIPQVVASNKKKEATMQVSDLESFWIFLTGIATFGIGVLIRRYFRKCAGCGQRIKFGSKAKRFCRDCWYERIDTVREDK
jgi:hypothetical protein